MTTYYVSKKKWYRGQGSDNSCLRSVDGKSCCLGFVGQQCRIRVKDMLDQPTPDDIPRDQRAKWPEWLVDPDDLINTRECAEAMRINDEVAISDRERMNQLRYLFRKHKTRLVFRP